MNEWPKDAGERAKMPVLSVNEGFYSAVETHLAADFKNIVVNLVHFEISAHQFIDGASRFQEILATVLTVFSRKTDKSVPYINILPKIHH